MAHPDSARSQWHQQAVRRCLFLVLFAGGLLLHFNSSFAATHVTNLRCENRVAPIGIDVVDPRLSWNLESTERDQRQTAYHVLVASSERRLSPRQADLWNSGLIESDQSLQLRYKGKPLSSAQVCFWKVGVRDRHGRMHWSEPARWSMGLLNAKDWYGQWIGLEIEHKTNWLAGTHWIWFPEGEPQRSAPPGQRYFRRTFALPGDRDVKRARMLLTGDNDAQAYVNGYHFGGHGNPQTTREIDITAQLIEGKNVIAISGRNGGEEPNPAGIAALIEIEFHQGPPMTLTTDELWRSRNRAEGEWQTVEFDDGAWRAAKKLGPVGMEPWGSVRAPESRRQSARYLRKEFNYSKSIRRATLFACGLGVSEFYLNGQKVGNYVLSPALSEYPKRLYYVTHDVTQLVKRGSNCIAAILGNGRYYSPRSDLAFNMPSYGSPKLLLQLRIEHSDGSVSHVVSDTSWRMTANGPIFANNEYDGEEYDARKEMHGWDRPTFNDSRWVFAELALPPREPLCAQMIEPIRVTQSLKPVSMNEPKPGVFVYDLGQNIVGWCRLKLTSPASRVITLRHAETLKPDGTLYIANLRGAHATDVYITRGGGEETWEPRFVYHGFRYVEVRGYPGKPPLDLIEGRVVHDDVESAGDFMTSNPLLNRIYQNIVWGTRGNYRSIPTDCPQRDERQGWLGDRSEVSRGESFIFNTQGFHEKWLRDIEDSQRETGSVPDVAPTYWPIYNDDVTWPSTSVMLPGILHDQFQDLAIVERHYPSALKWIDYMSGNYLTNGLIAKDTYGDWCVPPEQPELIHSRDPARRTDRTLLATAYFYRDLTLMARYAKLLDRTDDAQRLEHLAEQVKGAFNQRFLNREAGYYDNGSQTSCVLPLYFEMVPEEFRGRVFEQLVKKIEVETKGHIGTGLIGGMFLMRTLTQNGRADLAYTIANQRTYPSWGYMVEKGATTVWELWNGDTADPAMNSGNHVMLIGDLTVWFFEHLAGIKSDPKNPGFKHIIMKPEILGDLRSVKASHRSPYGWIRSEWRKGDTEFAWFIEVPPNSTATAFIPAARLESVLEGKTPVRNAPGVHSARFADGRVVLELGSGRYQFTTN